MVDCMMKKSKAVNDVKQQSPFMGVRTRSKTNALQSLHKDSVEFLQLGSSTKIKKVGGASGEVKKRQRKGSSGSKGRGNRGKKRRVDAVSDEERVVEEKGGEDLEEGLQNEEGMYDLGGVEDVGGAQPTVGHVAENDGDDLTGSRDDDAYGEDVGAAEGGIGGTAAISGGEGAEMGGDGNGGLDDAIIGEQPTICDPAAGSDVSGFVDAIGSAQPTICDLHVGGVAANAGGVGDSGIGAYNDDIVAGGGDAAKDRVDGTAAFSGGDNFLANGCNGWLPADSTNGHFSINSDYRTPYSSTKGAEFVADEKPQTEVGGNSHQHKEFTTDLLLQDNSNYAPSMEKYNFDFENEKPLPGLFEWQKVQP